MDKWIIKLGKPDISKQSRQDGDLVLETEQLKGVCSQSTCSTIQDLENIECNAENNNNISYNGGIEEEPAAEIEASTSNTSVAMQQSVDSTKEKPAKKKKHLIIRSYKFNPKWLEIENFKSWLMQSPKNKGEDPIEYAYCNLCHTNIFPNKADLLRHAKTEKHLNLNRVVKQTPSLGEIFNQSHFVNLRFAELKLAGALAEGNLPFAFMDTLSPLCAQIFPDSKIAKDIACKRTKTTSIVKENLGKHFQEEMISLLRKPGDFFSLIMDETTDVGTIKQCGFTVIFFSKSENKVVTRFFDLVEVALGNANSLYECLKQCLEIKKIPFKNLVGFACDTTNVMVGDFHSVFSHLKSELPQIALIKCSCHMIHLCGSKACLELPRRVEDVLRNIGAHFSRSFSRQNKFKEFQVFFGTEIHKILLPSQTRWLSLEQCCSRILEQYNPLTEYFRVLCFEDPSITNDQIFETLTNKYTKIYLEFMTYVLNMLNNFNTMFQSETPLLYKLKPEVEKLIKNLCSNFIEKNKIPKEHILNFDFKNPRNFGSLDKIYLGIAAYESIEMMKKEPHFDQKEMQTFSTSCLKFYLKLLSEIKSRFTFDDEVFDIISILEPKIGQNFEIKTLYPILIRFPILKEFVNAQELDNEWRDHALLDYDKWNLSVDLPAEDYWPKIFRLRNAANCEIFKNLKIVIAFLLILPFSNASVERLFSDLNNIKTDSRNRLNTDTIVALLATKDGIKNQGGSLKFKPSVEMLQGSIWKKK